METLQSFYKNSRFRGGDFNTFHLTRIVSVILERQGGDHLAKHGERRL
jgi:hypothetical protein